MVGQEQVQEFDEFCGAVGGRLVGQLHAMTGSRLDAEDAVQEALARAWQRWTAVSRHPSPEAWVRKTAWRIAVSRARRARVGLHKARERGPAPDTAGPSPDRVAVLRALQRLPAAQRQAVVLHHLVGLSVNEVAAEAGVPVGTVKARLSRGRAALAPLLTEAESSHA